MSEKMIHAGNAEICTQSFGDPADPAILLIMGAMASMLWWDEEFCRLIADRKRFVIRYDLRDTGRSTSYPPGAPPYTVNDLADDAMAVLDAYGIERAHLVGMSLGGMLAQVLALKCPSRVLSITMLASGPFVSDAPALPPIDQSILDYHASSETLDWSDEEAVVEYMVAGSRLLTGSAHTFDELAARDLARQEFRRAISIRSIMNYTSLGGGDEWINRLEEITAPALVIQGTEDIVLPYAHGEFLAGKIRGARLLTLQGTGHELHRDDWDTIVNAIVQHTGPAAEA